MIYSQSRRATNCATPGYLVFSEHPRVFPNQARYHLRYTRIFSFCYYTTLGAKIKDFPVCGQSCGQSRFLACFHSLTKSRKRPCRKAFRASVVAIVDGIGNTPKTLSQCWVREEMISEPMKKALFAYHRHLAIMEKQM